MKRVLITGAAGFIGSKLAEKLKGDDNNIIFLCDKILGNNSNCCEVDLTNIIETREYIHCIKPDIIFHCAGNANVQSSIAHPQQDFNSNVVTINNLLLSLLEEKMSNVKVVFLSSAAVYGNPNILPMGENEKLNPLSPYALDKMICENILYYYSKNHGFKVKIARIFSCYGEGLKKQILWDMFTKFKKTGELRMFGTGQESRDYIHVDDVTNCLILLSKDDSNEIIYNICNNEETKITTIVNMFAETMNINKSLISFSELTRNGEPINWCGSNQKIVKLGYKKTVELQDGISRYCKWLRTVE